MRGPPMNTTQHVTTFGQSLWLDNLSRSLLHDGLVARAFWKIDGFEVTPETPSSAISLASVPSWSRLRDRLSSQRLWPKVVTCCVVFMGGPRMSEMFRIEHVHDGKFNGPGRSVPEAAPVLDSGAFFRLFSGYIPCLAAHSANCSVSPC